MREDRREERGEEEKRAREEGGEEEEVKRIDRIRYKKMIAQQCRDRGERTAVKQKGAYCVPATENSKRTQGEMCQETMLCSSDS